MTICSLAWAPPAAANRLQSALGKNALPSSRRRVEGLRRHRLEVAARQRSTGRHTAYADSDRHGAAPGGTQRRAAPQKEPFDAELLVLFGLPSLVLLIAFAFNEPSSLAVAIPLVLVIPGPRDVLLTVAGDMLRAATRAVRFVATDSEDYQAVEEVEERQAQRDRRWWATPKQQQQQQQRQPSWGRRPPPPPPPPPAVDYELRAGEYNVYSNGVHDAAAAAPQHPSYQQQQQQPQQPMQPPRPYQHPSYMQQQQQAQQPPRPYQQPSYHHQQQPAPRSPFADGWPQSNPAADSGTWQQRPQQQQPAPRSPFADGWPQPAAGSGAWKQPVHQQQQQQQQQQPGPRSPFADGWPQAGPAAGSGAWRQQQQPLPPPQQPVDTRGWDSPSAGGPGSSARRTRARARGGGPSSAVAGSPAAARSAALSRRRRPGQGRQGQGRPGMQRRVGASAESRLMKDLAPLLLRPLFALIPFLRHWGGFL